MDASASVEERIDALDLSLYEAIPAQLNNSDKRSLLALHSACRAVYGVYEYLEIGSHLGGSLQAVIRNPACSRIVSIDPRPLKMRDEHKSVVRYPGNSTERMIELLRAIPGADITKIDTVEATTRTLDPASVAGSLPLFCYVDGEHSDDAVIADARFCRALTESDGGVIAFHDASTVYRALNAFLSELNDADVEFSAHLLPHRVFVFEIGPPRISITPQIAELLQLAGPRVLAALMDNDFYRRAWERLPFSILKPSAAESRRERLLSWRRS